jgi:hypothetical protein
LGGNGPIKNCNGNLECWQMKRTFDNLINTFKKRKTTESTFQDIDAPPDSDYLQSPGKDFASNLPTFNIINRNFKWKSKIPQTEKKRPQEPITQTTFSSPQPKRQSTPSLFDPFHLFSQKNKENTRGSSGIGPMFGSESNFMGPTKESLFEFTMKEYIPETPLFYFENQMVDMPEKIEIPKEIQVPSWTGKRKFEESTIMNKVEYLPSTLRLTLICARNLIATRKRNKVKSDPFVVVEYGLQKFISKVVYSTTDPQFGQTFSIFVDTAPQSLVFKLTVYDHDRNGEGDAIGSTQVDMSNAYQQSRTRHGTSDGVTTWVPLQNGTGDVFIVYKVLEGYNVKM